MIIETVMRTVIVSGPFRGSSRYGAATSQDFATYEFFKGVVVVL